MSDRGFDILRGYVQAASELTAMPLDADRAAAVATALARIAAFAANVEGFALADDVEIAGSFAR